MNNSILFLGIERDESSIICLSKLLESDLNVIAAISLKKKNTFKYFIKEQFVRHVVKKTSLEKIAQINGIDHKRVLNINSLESLNYIKKLNPDLICVCTFGQILKKDIIKIPRFGCINMHPSLLPEYRGADPVFWVIKNCEEETGVTVHYIDEGMDTGDIIFQNSHIIEEGTDIIDLKRILSVNGSVLMVEAIRKIFENNVITIKQKTGFKTVVPDLPDFIVDYNMNVNKIYNIIKGIKSYGAIFRIQDKDFQIMDAIDYVICSHNKFPKHEINKNRMIFYAKDGIIILKLKSFFDKLMTNTLNSFFGLRISFILDYCILRRR